MVSFHFDCSLSLPCSSLYLVFLFFVAFSLFLVLFSFQSFHNTHDLKNSADRVPTAFDAFFLHFPFSFLFLAVLFTVFFPPSLPYHSTQITPGLEELRRQKDNYLQWSRINTEVERLARFALAWRFAEFMKKLKAAGRTIC